MKKFIILLVFPILANAGIDYTSNNLVFLYSDKFTHNTFHDTSDGKKATSTYENYTAFSKLPLNIGGDIFSFFDYVNTTEKELYYFEIQPRLSIAKTFDKTIDFGLVQDITLNYQINKGNDYEAHLYGFGADLKIPFLDFSSIGYYYKTDNYDYTTQLSFAYGRKLSSRFHFLGFVEYTPDSIFTQNQLYYQLFQDIKYINIGLFWNYYNDTKYHQVSSVPELMLKLTF
ncbi:MAG: hypothetical protein HQL46_10245 [Gammaproteobacteria bacterium]|nr:hypothetical protein [Gammaproteobacteria bacterium]